MKQQILWVVEYRMGEGPYWWGRLSLAHSNRRVARLRCKRLREEEGHVTRVVKYIRSE